MSILTIAMTAVLCAQDGAELRLKLEKGAEHLYRFTQKQSFEVQGAAMEQTIGFLLAMQVKDVAADGTATVAYTYKGVSAKATGLLEFDYDSEKDKEPPAGAPQAAMLARMIGKTLTSRISPTGKILEVMDYEKFVEGLLEGEENEALRGMMKEMFSGEAFKSQMQGMAPALPEKKVKPGDTWKDEMDYKLPLPISMKFVNTSTLKEIKDGKAVIDQDVKIEFKANPDQPDQALPFQMKDAKGRGTLVFSLDKGQFLSQKMVMEMTMDIAGNEMPMKMEQEMKLVEAKKEF